MARPVSYTAKAAGGVIDAAHVNQLQTDVGLIDAALATAEASNVNVRAHGAVAYAPGTAYASMTDSAAAINAAVAAAKAAGTVAVAHGRFRIDSTVTIDCDADFSAATFVCSNTALVPAVRIGTTSAVVASQPFRITVHAPHLIQAAKTGLGWVGTSVGLEVCNIYRSRVFLGRIQHFTTGLLVSAYGTGETDYNDFFEGHCDNNKINVHIAPLTGVATNEGSFYGLSCSHNSEEGANVSGTRHILLTSIVGSQPNNWLFVRASLESPNVVAYTIESIGGFGNTWLQCRWEYTTGSPRVWWNQLNAVEHSQANRIIGGYDAEQIIYTNSVNSYGNDTDTEIFATKHGITQPAWRLGNRNTSDGPLLEAVDANTDPLTAGTGDWLYKLTAAHSLFKAKASAIEALKITHGSGTVSWGGQAAAVDASLEWGGTDRLTMGAGDYFRTGAVAALPTASSLYRGYTIRVEGGTGVADGLHLCEKNIAGAYVWRAL